jgi:DNA-binding protein HU-beta
MAKPMSKSKIVAALAEKVDIPKKTSAAYLEALAQLAHKEAKNGFTIPGVGKLVVRNYKARMGRNPQTGVPVTIPARKRLKFVVTKGAKDSALKQEESVLDLFSSTYRKLG